jgi:hypothetical protein
VCRTVAQVSRWVLRRRRENLGWASARSDSPVAQVRVRALGAEEEACSRSARGMPARGRASCTQHRVEQSTRTQAWRPPTTTLKMGVATVPVRTAAGCDDGKLVTDQRSAAAAAVACAGLRIRGEPGILNVSMKRSRVTIHEMLRGLR